MAHGLAARKAVNHRQLSPADSKPCPFPMAVRQGLENLKGQGMDYGAGGWEEEVLLREIRESTGNREKASTKKQFL